MKIFKKDLLSAATVVLLATSVGICSVVAFAHPVHNDFSEELPFIQTDATTPFPTETPTEPADPEPKPAETTPPEAEPAATVVPDMEEAQADKQAAHYETMYAISAVNVRIGPGTEYDILGVLNANENVQCIISYDNGWSQVIYMDEEAYVNTKYLAKTKPDAVDANVSSKATHSSSRASSTPEGNYGPYIGRFTIPGTGVSVNCYNSYSQATVDAANSAAVFSYESHIVIADHVNQGFSGIKTCEPGTKAYFDTDSGMKEYTCIDVIQGHNTGSTLTDENYNSIESLYPGALVCYTCNENSRNVTIVFFKITGAPDEFTGEGNEFYPTFDLTVFPRDASTHKWELVDSFEFRNADDPDQQLYLRERFVCSVCNSDWVRNTPTGEKVIWEEEQYEEPAPSETPAEPAPNDPTPTEEPTQITEPVATAPIPTEPADPEPKPAETTPPEAEPAADTPTSPETPIEALPEPVIPDISESPVAEETTQESPDPTENLE